MKTSLCQLNEALCKKILQFKKKKKICFLYSAKQTPNCKRSWVHSYHVSTWVPHWRWKNTLQLNTTNNRRTVVKNLVEIICPYLPQYVKYVAASLLHQFTCNYLFEEFMLQTSCWCFFLWSFSFMPMTLCGEVLNCI